MLISHHLHIVSKRCQDRGHLCAPCFYIADQHIQFYLVKATFTMNSTISCFQQAHVPSWALMSRQPRPLRKVCCSNAREAHVCELICAYCPSAWVCGVIQKICTQCPGRDCDWRLHARPLQNDLSRHAISLLSCAYCHLSSLCDGVVQDMDLCFVNIFFALLHISIGICVLLSAPICRQDCLLSVDSTGFCINMTLSKRCGCTNPIPCHVQGVLAYPSF